MSGRITTGRDTSHKRVKETSFQRILFYLRCLHRCGRALRISLHQTYRLSFGRFASRFGSGRDLYKACNSPQTIGTSAFIHPRPPKQAGLQPLLAFPVSTNILTTGANNWGTTNTCTTGKSDHAGKDATAVVYEPAAADPGSSLIPALVDRPTGPAKRLAVGGCNPIQKLFQHRQCIP